MSDSKKKSGVKNIFQLLKPKSLTAYIYEASTLRQAIEIMRNHGYTAVPVIDGEGRYVKAIAEGDFLWFMLSHDISDVTELEDYFVADVPKRVVCAPVYVNSTIDELFKLSVNQNFVPVIDDRDVFIGIVTRKDILLACYDELKESDMFLHIPEYERYERESSPVN